MRTAVLIVLALACRPDDACRPNLSGAAVMDLTAPAAPQLPYAAQALELGRTHDEAMYAAFSRGYELAPNEAIDKAEVITEFRRAVMIVHDRARQGDYVFTAPDLAKAMAPFEGQVSFVVQVRLHPLHTYATTPPFALYVETGPATRPLAPKPFARDPVLPPGMFGPGNPIVAVRMEGAFERAGLAAAPAPSLVVTDDQANVLWKARIDLARYR